MVHALAAVGVGHARSVRRVGGGHIHETWLVSTPAGRIVAQRLNGVVFRDLDACEVNLRRIEEHLSGRADVVVPSLMRGADGRVHVDDRLGDTWRISRYAGQVEYRVQIRCNGIDGNVDVRKRLVAPCGHGHGGRASVRVPCGLAACTSAINFSNARP